VQYFVSVTWENILLTNTNFSWYNSWNTAKVGVKHQSINK
jgi:hypothetical protein